MKLATTYLGFKLRTPLVPSASPLSEKLDNIKRMEDAGASAVVFHSLFEEQLRPANHPMRRGSGNGGEFSSRRARRLFRRTGLQGRSGGVRQSHRKSERGGAHSDHRQLERLDVRRLATVRPAH